MKRLNNLPPQPGIYFIRNKINNKIYVGSASNLKIRKNGHIFSLSHNKHHSRHLQRSYNKYGECNFEFIIAEIINETNIEVLRNKLLEREQFYIDTYKTSDFLFGYNINPTAKSCLGVKRTEETRKRYKLAQRKLSKFKSEMMNSPKYQQLLKEKLSGKNNPMFGKKHTIESKNKMGHSQKGHLNSMFGKKHSIESKLKIGIKSVGRMSKQILVFDLNNRFLFECKTITEAQEKTKVWHYNITKCATGKIPHSKKYIFRYKI